jgi:CheY-like chemotaxis protein
MDDTWPAILIIDDEFNMRYFATELFRLEGISSHAVSDGCQGLDFLTEVIQKQGRLPRVIILDMMMPCKDGYQVYAEIADADWIENTEIVIVSAARGIELPRGRAKVHILYKPYEVTALLDIVRRAAPDLFGNQAPS